MLPANFDTAVDNLSEESKKMKKDIRSVMNGLDDWKIKGHINNVKPQLDAIEKSLVEVKTEQGNLEGKITTIEEKIEFHSKLK